MNVSARIALFVDFDNAQLAAAELNLTHCRWSQLWVAPLVREIERVGQGTVEVRRCYGNTLLNSGRVFRDKIWNAESVRDRIAADLDLQTDLVNNGFLMVHCPSAGEGKNRADILMSLDCLEIANTYDHIDTFAILSHDTDFSPLNQRLRTLGKEVILVTVGRPKTKGMRALEAHTKVRVVYDQDVVDGAGYDALAGLVAELSRPDDAGRVPLSAGVGLDTIRRRLADSLPGFLHEHLGFDQFRDFVEACIEPPLRLDGGRLLLFSGNGRSLESAYQPVPGRSAGQVQSSAPATGAAPSGRRQAEFQRSFTGQKLRPVPELRRNIAAWIRSEILGGGVVPTEPITLGELRERVEQVFHPLGNSKSQITDAMRILTLSGSIDVQRAEGGQFLDAKVTSLAAPEQSRTMISRFMLMRLETDGVIVSDNDVDDFCDVVFGDKQTVSLEAVRRAFQLARENATEDPVSASMRSAALATG